MLEMTISASAKATVCAKLLSVPMLLIKRYWMLAISVSTTLDSWRIMTFGVCLTTNVTSRDHKMDFVEEAPEINTALGKVTFQDAIIRNANRCYLWQT